MVLGTSPPLARWRRHLGAALLAMLTSVAGGPALGSAGSCWRAGMSSWSVRHCHCYAWRLPDRLVFGFEEAWGTERFDVSRAVMSCWRNARKLSAETQFQLGSRPPEVFSLLVTSRAICPVTAPQSLWGRLPCHDPTQRLGTSVPSPPFSPTGAHELFAVLQSQTWR